MTNRELPGEQDELPKSLDDLLERAAQEAELRNMQDPEWTTRKHVHVKTIIEGFAIGVVAADCYHLGYQVPPNFERVLNHVCRGVTAEWPDFPVPHISLAELEARYWGWVEDCPEFHAWNDGPGSGFTSRGTPTPSGREFIDLHALIRNAVLYVLHDIRRFEEFNRDFDARWKATHG